MGHRIPTGTKSQDRSIYIHLQIIYSDIPFDKDSSTSECIVYLKRKREVGKRDGTCTYVKGLDTNESLGILFFGLSFFPSFPSDLTPDWNSLIWLRLDGWRFEQHSPLPLRGRSHMEKVRSKTRRKWCFRESSERYRQRR